MAELATGALNLEEKAKTVAAVQEKFKAAKMAIVTEYRGLTVAQMTRQDGHRYGISGIDRGADDAAASGDPSGIGRISGD